MVSVNGPLRTYVACQMGLSVTSGSCITPLLRSRITLPHIPSGIFVVGLAAFNMVQLLLGRA